MVQIAALGIGVDADSLLTVFEGVPGNEWIGSMSVDLVLLVSTVVGKRGISVLIQLKEGLLFLRYLQGL